MMVKTTATSAKKSLPFGRLFFYLCAEMKRGAILADRKFRRVGYRSAAAGCKSRGSKLLSLSVRPPGVRAGIRQTFLRPEDDYTARGVYSLAPLLKPADAPWALLSGGCSRGPTERWELMRRLNSDGSHHGEQFNQRKASAFYCMALLDKVVLSKLPCPLASSSEGLFL